MITRVYLKDCLSFEEVDLEFKNGLNIFTGPSGAGKSILMQAILSLFALADVKADLGEVLLNDSKISDEIYDLSLDDDIIIKSIKKEKVRYFLNNQSVSKKNLNDFSTKLIKHLNLKDTSEFDSLKLLDFLDKLTSQNNTDFVNIKEIFNAQYKEFIRTKKGLQHILEDENKLEDLKEFARFEIDKIEQINPSIDEYEELNLIKKRLAKKEKIEVAIKKASGIMEFTHNVTSALELMEVDSSFFDETINELNNIFENQKMMYIDFHNLDLLMKPASFVVQQAFHFLRLCNCHSHKRQNETLPHLRH